MIGKKEHLNITNFVNHSISKLIYQNRNIDRENWRAISLFRTFSFELFLFYFSRVYVVKHFSLVYIRKKRTGYYLTRVILVFK